MYRYMKEWHKNPQWSLSCCLALFLPLNELSGEIHGLAGRNVLKQQLQTGKIDMPSMSSSFKDSGVVNFDLGEDQTEEKEKRHDDKTATNRGLGHSHPRQDQHHDLPRQTCDTPL